MIIDFHAHFFPALSKSFENRFSPQIQMGIQIFKSQGKMVLEPVFDLLHKTQPNFRFLPAPLRGLGDQLGSLASLSSLALGHSCEDLIESMQNSDVSRAVVVGHPPYVSNGFLLEECSKNQELIAAVYISKNSKDPKKDLQKCLELGAKLLKIHPSADGLSVDSDQYRILLETAAEADIPVILHTGSLMNRVFYADPGLGKCRPLRTVV